MKRYCLALDLVNDPALIAEYQQWHAAGSGWPGITESIARSGIVSMEIYRTGNRLFMVMETDDSFTFDQKAALDAADPKVKEWEELMWKFQQPLPWAGEGEKWIVMDKIYSLEENKRLI
jgi:L-rhamnose mutarotase